MKLSEAEIKELADAFKHELNYESDDIDAPIDPLTYKNPEGDSCLHIAAVRGDYRAIELLIKAGADINQTGDMGKTALHYAKSFGHENVVKLLIENGALTDIKSEFGKTALE